MAITYYDAPKGGLEGEFTGNQATTYMTDALGSTIGTIQDSGVQNSYVFKPFGGLLQKTGIAPDPFFLWNARSGYRTTGRAYAEEYVQRRHYSTTTSQWSTDDPTWPRQRHYAYTGNRPVSRSDPSGLGLLYGSDEYNNLINWFNWCMANPAACLNGFGGIIIGTPPIVSAPCFVCPDPPPPAWPSPPYHGDPPTQPSGGGGYMPTYPPIANPTNCAGGVLGLGACLAGCYLDIITDKITDPILGPINTVGGWFGFDPIKPPHFAPEPPDPIVDPDKLPKPCKDAADKAKKIAAPITCVSECFIQFYNSCYGSGSEPWQQCPNAGDRSSEACGKCCEDIFWPNLGNPQYGYCTAGCGAPKPG